MSLFMRNLHKTEAHPDWVLDAYQALARTMKLRCMKMVPSVLEVTLTVTPIRRMLRGIYGSDWAAVQSLARAAAEGTLERVRGTVWCFWRYRVQMKSPEVDLNEMLDPNLEDEEL